MPTCSEILPGTAIGVNSNTNLRQPSALPEELLSPNIGEWETPSFDTWLANSNHAVGDPELEVKTPTTADYVSTSNGQSTSQSTLQEPITSASDKASVRISRKGYTKSRRGYFSYKVRKVKVRKSLGSLTLVAYSYT
jgi:hypothetical protein